MLGKTIQIYCPSGDPRGVRIAEITTRIVQAVVVPRARLDDAQRAGLWEELATDWLCLDCELMPWSAKAQALIREQYAAISIAAAVGLTAAVASLTQAKLRPPEIDSLLAATSVRADLADRYVKAYQRYCWNVSGVDDLRLAPFHLLASKGALAPRARVRVRRPGDGERTRRPEVVMNPVPRVVRAIRKGFQS